MEEHPGPPLNHVASGAVVGLFLASKNQNHLDIVRGRAGKERTGGMEAGEHTCSCSCPRRNSPSTGLLQG